MYPERQKKSRGELTNDDAVMSIDNWRTKSTHCESSSPGKSLIGNADQLPQLGVSPQESMSDLWTGSRSAPSITSHLGSMSGSHRGVKCRTG